MRIAMIGAGNLATRLTLELHKKGIDIIQVYSKTTTSALTLARLVGCNYVTRPEKIVTNADLYIIAVSDKVIEKLTSKINFNNKLIVHTAGSIDINVLKKGSKNYGVFYPLQTFSKYREVNFSKIPFCLEANNKENLNILTELANLLSSNIYIVSSEQRKQLHLAAVFACNFVNHFYAISEEIVKEKDLPFEIIQPLIAETASKIKTFSPRSAQTGPAVRNDKSVISNHLDMLQKYPQWKKLYSFVSDSIFEYQNKIKK